MTRFNFYVGQQEQVKHKLKATDVSKFRELSGDNNPIHSDKKFTSKTHLKDPIAHGMLGVNFISSVIGNKLPGSGALWMSQTLEFISPARVGDNLTITVIVKLVFELEKILTLETIITKNNGELVTRGIATVKVLSSGNNDDPLLQANPSKVAIVIGGSGGIGSAISAELARNGYKVMISFKSDEGRATKLVDEIEGKNGICQIFKSDLSNLEDIETLISETISLYGSVSHLIFCASPSLSYKPINELSWEDFMLQVTVHVRILFEVTQKLIPVFQANGYGNVIAIGSSFTDNPPTNLSPYIAAKSSLVGLMKGMAKELGPKKIRVNVISPSFVETLLSANVTERSRLITKKNTPSNRLTLPTDVSDAVLFLAEEKSSQISGQNIIISGGA